MARAVKKTAAKKSAAKKKRSVKKTKTKASAAEGPVETATAKPTTGSMLAPLEDLEKAFEHFLDRRGFHPLRWARSPWHDFSEMLDERIPSVDVVDRAKEVMVKAEIPGIEREDLDVSVVDRTLTIKGSSRREETEEKDDFFRREIRAGKFSRSVLLPADVNAAKAKAKFKDGVLELRLPKVRASKRHKIAMADD
jgi:HSP20 family protein